MTLATQEELTVPVKGKHVLAIMTVKDGDLRIMWDPDLPDEVAHAKKTFEEFKKKGHAAYSVGRKGKKGDLLSKFDPEAEAMIMAPICAGG